MSRYHECTLAMLEGEASSDPSTVEDLLAWARLAGVTLPASYLD